MKQKNFIACNTINGDPVMVEENQIVNRSAVYAIIVNEEKNVLLVKQWDGYDFPGGGVEPGESLNDALSREVLEETGYQILLKSLLKSHESYFYHPVKEQAYHTWSYYYTALVIGGTLNNKKLDKSELEYAGDAVWISCEEIDTINFHNAVDSPLIIQEALAIEPIK